MFNRLYFTRNLKFIPRKDVDAYNLAINCKFPGNQVLKCVSTMRLIGSSKSNRNLLANSKLLRKNVGLLARPNIASLILKQLRYYQTGSKWRGESWKRKISSVVRWILLVSGGMVWLAALIAYISLDKVTVDVLESESNAATETLLRKLAEHFYQEKNADNILKKTNAIESIWQKLSQEEQIKEIFGQPVFICGYHYNLSNEMQDLGQFTNEVDEAKGEKQGKQEMRAGDVEAVNNLVWQAGCYVEGPKQVGLMTVKFENHKEEWVPVSLNLETLRKTGHVVSDVSGLLPNGIKNFTRLSN